MSKIYDDFDKLKEIVKNYVQHGSDLDSFMWVIRAAIREAIADGYMFIDYLQWRHEMEGELEMDYDTDKWDDILIKAMGADDKKYMEYASGRENDSLWEKLGLEPKYHEIPEFIIENIKKALECNDL